MRDRFLVHAVGAVIEIDVSRRAEDFRARAFDAWADARHEGGGVPDAVAVVPVDTDDAAALSALSTEVTLAALAEKRGTALWMLHAAGLADEHGRVIVMSAPSGTGKTTAARHLSRRFAYVSDETVAITADGAVVPYRKPLSIIAEGTQHKVQVAPSSLHGDRPLWDDLRVAKIVVLDRSADGPAVPDVEALDLATALELLAPQSSYLSDMPAPLHAIRGVLAAAGGAVRVRYREVDTLDEVVDGFLSAEAPSADRWPEETAAAPEQIAPAATADGLVRTPVVDALELDGGRLAVLRRSDAGSRLHILDGIGPAVWEAAPGRTIAEITDEVVAAHGRPEGADAQALVSAAVAQLIADDLLRSVDSQS